MPYPAYGMRNIDMLCTVRGLAGWRLMPYPAYGMRNIDMLCIVRCLAG